MVLTQLEKLIVAVFAALTIAVAGLAVLGANGYYKTNPVVAANMAKASV